ncbi:MAG: isoleucine--tRNA ligase [Lentisphaerae bacterium]|nr:isoleucine--tRNA ligase [Lentisphaerota bacterium]
MFKDAPRKMDFPALERETLAFWKERDLFRRSVEQRRGGREFVFYDGPPFATGLPHYGHLLAGTIKDVVPRYQAMRGACVERRFGWDCHGLPVEVEVEQSLKVSGKREIEALGVDRFNESCRGIVLRYTREWREIVTRMGRWVDFDRDYKTMDPAFMESIWWVFRQLWDKGLIYEGRKILPYCPRCATPLSNFETNQGYQEVQDPAITVRFRLTDEPATWILAWTTTPWTLPSNLALAVGPDIPYVRVQDGDAVYILARERLGVYYKKPGACTILEELPGSALAGRRYEPLFPYFHKLAAAGAFRIVTADFVSTEDGTGVVHMAPGFGEDDYRVAQQEGVPAVCPMDEEGRFTAEVPEYAGQEVKQADPAIIKRLKQEGKLVHQGTIQHSYPHCWRCDTPLLYRSVATWFVRVEAIRDRILAANREVQWVPEHLRDGRFGRWLEQARDWAISRNRYWGTPLPVWQNEDGTERVCVGSIAELERLTGTRVTDLHKHFIDRLTIPAPSGRGLLRRIPEVLDCWFESGAMTYAQAHYPFEQKARFEAHFPADFIAEGLDQTRGWFYTLMVLSTALFDRPAFRHVVVNGLVLAADGRKMSKRLKNYPDPLHVVETYGADALRLYLLSSPVVRAEDLRFSEEGVRQVMRDILIPLWNAYTFFVTYAATDRWTPDAASAEPSPHLLDRWIRSSLSTLIRSVAEAMDQYDLQRAVRPFVQFVEDLTNWYIRRSRRRFWKSQDDADKRHAYGTLYQVLVALSKVAAPFVPFLSEVLFRALRPAGQPESVHLCDFPEADETARDPVLEAQMGWALAVVKMGRQLRAEHDLKVRQPLARMHVACRRPEVREALTGLCDLLADELNVKAVAVSEREDALATLTAKPQFSRLGPRLGPRVKQAAGAIQALDADALERLAAGGAATITLGGAPVELTADDVVLTPVPRPGLVVASAGGIVVALETALDEALVREGRAREFVNRVQTLRKERGLDVAQRIALRVAADPAVRQAVEAHRDYVLQETLCVSCVFAEQADAEAGEINGLACRIQLVTPPA